MSIPLCRQVIQGWMDIYPFRLVNEASMSGRYIAQQWRLRKAVKVRPQQDGLFGVVSSVTLRLMQRQKLQRVVELVRIDDVM